MKRFLLLIPVALIAVIASLAPVSISFSNVAHLSSNNATAVSMNVYCKSGDSGYTGDTQTAADFCKQFNSTPVDVSRGIYPFKCVKGVFYGTDAPSACKAHGGVATGYLCASDTGATLHYGESSAIACKAFGGAYVAPTGVCGPDFIAVSIPIFASDGKCVPNDPASGGAIVWYTKQLIKLASGAVGSIILLMLLVAGIQYITAAGDPGRVKLAKTRITNSVIALILFLMAFAILSFLIPGGIFS